MRNIAIPNPVKFFTNRKAQVGGSGFGSFAAPNVLDIASKKAFASFLAFFALILWVVDITIIPWLGGVYSGFNFNPAEFWSSWFRQFTFGNVYFSGSLIIIALIFVVRYAREKKLPQGGDIAATSLFVITMVFMLSNWGWMAYPKAILHFLFILTFGFFVWRTAGVNSAFLIMSAFFFLDFFLYSTILKYVPLLKYISLIGAIVIVWTFGENPNFFNGTLFMLLLVFIMVMTIAEGRPDQGRVTFTDAQVQKASLNEVFLKGKTGIAGWRRQIGMSINKQVEYAITGKVEQNKYEPLGVYLGELRSDQPRYYDNEPVSIWGTIKARTLDEPVAIQLSCFIKDGTNKNPADKEDPENQLQVFTLEEQDFACLFKPDTLKKSSSKTITAAVDFNFQTLAYVKRYFIDVERKRNMQRENQDPFEVYKIKERNPVSVSTNGPAEVGIKTNEVLYGVSYGYLNYPSIELSIQNRMGWEGKITYLNELILLFPKGASIINPESIERGGDCNKKFVPYTLNDCQEKSCKLVNEQCLGVCEGYVDPKKPADYRAAENCKNMCAEAAYRCIAECQYLFQEDGQQYIGYSLDVSEIEKYREEDYGRFLYYRCKFDPQPDSILENTPITTKSFRVKASYEYRLEKTKTVTIQEDPNKPKPLVVSNTGDAALVVKLARDIGVPEDVAFALGARMSEFNHCKSGPCDSQSDIVSQIKCSNNKCGIMGVDDSYNPALFDKYSPESLQFGCKAQTNPPNTYQTAYDKECNIKIGLTILKQLSEDGDYQSKITCARAPYLENYKLYNSNPWEKALRAYRGYDCDAIRDPSFVEIVKRIRDDYNAGKYNDIKKMADTVSLTSAGTSGLQFEVKYNPSYPGQLYLVWYEAKTPFPKVKIWRKIQDGTEIQIFSQDGYAGDGYTDSLGSLQYNQRYYYRISLEYPNGEFKTSENTYIHNYRTSEIQDGGWTVG